MSVFTVNGATDETDYKHGKQVEPFQELKNGR